MIDISDDPQVFIVGTAERLAYQGLEVKMSVISAQLWADVICNNAAILERFGPRKVTVDVLRRSPDGRIASSSRTKPFIKLAADGRNFKSLIHELSHQYTDSAYGNHHPPHSPLFTRTHLFIARSFMGEDFAKFLRLQYRRHEVKIARETKK